MNSTHDDFLRWQEQQKKKQLEQQQEQKKVAEPTQSKEVKRVQQVQPPKIEAKEQVKEKTVPKVESNVQKTAPEQSKETRPVTPKITKPKKEEMDRPKAKTVTVAPRNKEPLKMESYVARELKYGIGLGVTGLGKMVHLEEKINANGEVEHFYRLRKANDKPRMTSNSNTTFEDAIYKEDVYKTSTPRISTDLMEYVVNIYAKKINNTNIHSISMKDFINFLFLKELDDELIKETLAKAFIESNASTKSNDYLITLLAFDKESKTNSSENTELQELLIQSIDRQNNAISEMAQQNKTLQEQNRHLAEQLYGLTRTLAYQEGIRTGLVTASRLNTPSDFLGALATDETTRIVNAIQETGSNEMARQITIQNGEARRNLK